MDVLLLNQLTLIPCDTRGKVYQKWILSFKRKKREGNLCNENALVGVKILREDSLCNENGLVVGVKVHRKGYCVNSNECRNLCRMTDPYFFRLATQMEGLEVAES